MTATVVRDEPVEQATLLAPERRIRRSLEAATFVLAGLIGWVVLFATLISSYSYGHAQSGLYGELRSELAAGTAPLAAPITHGRAVALLDAPALGWKHLVVVEGTTPADLTAGPGHAIGTSLPGQVGISVLMGRALTFGGPFGGLGAVTAGTPVTVTTGQGTFTYVVSARRTNGSAYRAPAPGASRLTLVTLTGTHAWSPTTAVFIDLDLRGKAVASTAAAAADPAGAPLARDRGVATLALLVLSLQLLVLVVVGWAWARRRWSAIGAWVCGVPALVMALWLVSTYAFRMLPNLL